MERKNLIGSTLTVIGRSGLFNQAAFHRGIRLTPLLLMAVMLAAAFLVSNQPAHGQTTTTLVSNTGEIPATVGPVELDRVDEGWGQPFTTGSGVPEFRLDSIGIRFATIDANADPGSELTVTLNDANVTGAGEKPNDDVLCTLTNPGTFTSDAVNTFDAPTSGDTCPFLKPNTAYAVAIKRDITSFTSTTTPPEISLDLASTRDQADPTSTGWVIFDEPAAFYGPDSTSPSNIGTWVRVSDNLSHSLMLEVKGATIEPQLTSAITAFTVESDGWNIADANVTVASTGTVYVRWKAKGETTYGDNLVSEDPGTNNKVTLRIGGRVGGLTHLDRYVVQAAQDESFSDPAQLEFTHEWNNVVRGIKATKVTLSTALVEVTLDPDIAAKVAVTDQDVDGVNDVHLFVYWWADAPGSATDVLPLLIPINTINANNKVGTILLEGLTLDTTYILAVYDNNPAHKTFFRRFPRASFTTPAAAVFSRASLIIDEGESDTYTLALGTQPTATVTIRLSTNDGAVTTRPTSLRFTRSNWDTPQTVTVDADHDNNADDEVVTITHEVTSNGDAEYAALRNLDEVSVTVLDDDIPPPAVRGFAAGPESQDAIALSWWSERDADEYEVEYRKGGDTGAWTQVTRGDFDHRPSTSSNRSLSAIATGLECETTYYFRIRLRGSGDGILDAFGPYTETSHKTGQCAQPDRPTNLMYTLAPDCATLTWTAPTGGDYTGVRIWRLTLGDDNFTVIHESLNSRRTRYQDCKPPTPTDDSYGVGDNPQYAYKVTYIKSGSFEPVESKPASSGLHQYGPAFQDHLHATPRNVRLTRDTDSQRRMSWDAPPSWSLTTWAGLQGASVPVRDPWITGYVVERREFRARADGYLYFSDAEEDLPVWSATMTVEESSSGTETGYKGTGDLIGSLSQDTFNHVAGRYRVYELTYGLGRLQLTIGPFPPTHATEDWDLVIDGTRFSLADAYITDGGPGLALISWTTSSPSWANGQQVSVQLIDRDRYGWKTVREGDTGTSFTDNEQANGRKFVYRIRSTNKYGTSTTHSIFDWLWDSPYRDAIVDLAATDTTTDDSSSGNTGDGSANSPATGAPAISGTPQVDQTLTASTSNIDDEDGLTNVSYSYQWIAGGSDIAGATGSTHTLTSSEQGQTIQVRVTFTDDADNEETLTSIATAAVAAAPEPLTATFPASPYQSARHKGADDRPQVIVAFSLTVASFEKTTPSVSLTGAAVRSVRQHEEDGLDNAWMFFLDPDGSDDIVFSLVTGQPCDSGGICTEDGTTLSGGVQVTLPGPDEETEPENPTPDDPNSPATGLPSISGTAQVGETLTANTSNIDDQDGLDNVSYRYQWVRNDGTDDTDIAGETSSTYTLVGVDQGQTIRVKVTFTDDAGNDESLTSAATETVLARPNRAAAGLPTISGTPQVEQTLTADTSGISDEDGLSNVSYTYQWIAGGADIDGATGASYTLTADEEGDTIQVRVTFTDDADNAETLTSVATVAVAAAPVPLTAEFQDLPDSHDGSATFIFQVLFSEDVGISYVNMRDDAFSVSDGDVTGARRVNGRNDLWEITVEPDDNSDVGITLPANRSCSTAGAICTKEDTPRQLTNSPSATVPGPDDDSSSDTTEEPTATSQLSVADATASEEDDSTIDFVVTLNPASEESVTVDYATANGTASSGSDYTAASGSITFAAGETSRTITVAIIDDSTEEDDETLTLTLSNPSGAEISDGVATGTITDSEPIPLTATFSNVPASHDGSTEFTFDLTFSEEFGISYATLRDHAFSITGGSVEAAQRTDKPSNISWSITVKPLGNGTITITLPETTDCNADGAICTDDGRKLSNSTTVTVAGPE